MMQKRKSLAATWWGGRNMYLSFEGIKYNAERQLKDIEALAKRHDEYDEYEHQTGLIMACISAYHDCLLGIMKGEVEVDEIKNFLFHGYDAEKIKKIPYCGSVVKFTESVTSEDGEV